MVSGPPSYLHQKFRLPRKPDSEEAFNLPGWEGMLAFTYREMRFCLPTVCRRAGKKGVLNFGSRPVGRMRGCILSLPRHEAWTKSRARRWRGRRKVCGRRMRWQPQEEVYSRRAFRHHRPKTRRRALVLSDPQEFTAFAAGRDAHKKAVRALLHIGLRAEMACFWIFCCYTSDLISGFSILL